MSHETQGIHRTGRARVEANRRAAARALLLVIHDGKMCSAEGETWELDFSSELERIDEVLQMAGIDTTQPLHCPIRWRDEDEDGDK
ncbi:hypothetical protein [Paraburkholderia diazotrophica]|uniref:hypothetical protein n=1 Tax=Paraburkholderia diazotrophica TaxID=667676 RepID=UPI00115FA817|nr:hypothetical protein [Paraburkholderia diazotrophica]